MNRKAAFRLNAETGKYSTRRNIGPEDVLQEAQRILLSRIKERPALKDPAAVKSYLATALAGKEKGSSGRCFSTTSIALLPPSRCRSAR